MSPNALATKLIQCSRSSSLLVPGPLIAEIGPEAVQDALTRGWLRPDMETGFLMLTDQQSQLQEMRDLAVTPEAEAPKPAQESASRAFAMQHSSRRLHETLGLGGDTSGAGGAPGSGQPQSTMVPPAQTPTSQTPNRPGQDYMVGEDVVVADEGKAYQAKVQTKNPDGTYKLSFGPNRPTQQDRMFRREEMQKVQPGGQKVNTLTVQQ